MRPPRTLFRFPSAQSEVWPTLEQLVGNDPGQNRPGQTRDRVGRHGEADIYPAVALSSCKNNTAQDEIA